MTNQLGSLVVSLGMDAAHFVAGLSKAEYETKQRVDSITRQFSGIGKAIAGLGLGAALTQAINSTAEYTSNVEKLAKLSNTSNEEFQRQAYAAKSLGIGMEELASKYKDVQEKVGEFMRSGGGELKEFFEKIAPRVGVTADQFARLSGPEALQLYVTSLQKAGVSQNEMVTYMEAIADDSTKLLPLLQNNGKGMRDLGDEAQRLGKVLDDDAIRAGKEFERNVQQLTGTLDSLKMLVGNSVIPTINGLGTAFATAHKHSSGFWETFRLAGAANFGLGGVGLSGVVSELEKAESRLNKLQSARKPGSFSFLDASISDAQTRVDYLRDLRNQIKFANQQFDPADQSGAEARRLGIAPPTRVPPQTPTPKGKVAKETDPAIKAASEREEEFQALLRDRLGIVKQMEDAGKALYESTRTPIEQLAAKEAEYADLRKRGYITDETYWRAREAAQDAYETSLERVGVQIVEQGKEAEEQARRLGDAYAGAFSQAFTAGSSFGDLLKRLAFETINIQFLTPAAQKAGNWLSSGVSSLFKSFDGGGYTGSGSRSGGLDGNGGYLAMLHPNETVLDHTRGQGLAVARDSGGSVNISQVFNFGNSDASTVAALRAEGARIKSETLAAVQSRANRGGSFARSMGRA